jgi:serine/threonine-protein kinase
LLGIAATLGLFDIEQTLLPVTGISPIICAITTVVVVSFLALTFWLARLSRAATLRAISQLETARRQLRQREALLDEARADLNHVLDAGRLGSYSGRSVGPYRLEESVGRGAMGEVYAAVDSRDSSSAAVKLLHPYILDDPTHVERFFREAEVASSLASPHIVQILSNGFTDDGSPIAMDAMGHDLSHLRRRLRLGRSIWSLVSRAGRGPFFNIVRDLAQNPFLNDGAGKLWKVSISVSPRFERRQHATQGAVGAEPHIAGAAARAIRPSGRFSAWASLPPSPVDPPSRR